MDLSGENPFGDLMSKAVKLKGHQQAQLRPVYDSWPQYFQHSMFMQESVTSMRTELFPDKILAAEAMKKTGNDHFASGDYQEAVAEYEKALAIFKYAENTDPGWKKKGIVDKDIRTVEYKCENEQDQQRLDALKVACYLNIAVSKFKLREFPVCLQACDDTLQVDPKNVKALYRRAQALITPKSSGALEFDQALQSLQQAYTIDPENRQVLKLLTELREQKVLQKKLDKATFSGMFNRGAVYEGDEENKRQEQPLDPEKAAQTFAKEVDEAEQLARMCEAKGQAAHAQEIREKVRLAQEARMKQRKQIDFFHPTPEMIEDGKKNGIDLTDRKVQEMLHLLQEEERKKENGDDEQGGFDPAKKADSSSPFDVEESPETINKMLDSMTNEEIANMLTKAGIEYHSFTDREQFRDAARQVLRASLGQPKTKANEKEKDKNLFTTILIGAFAWTLLRFYANGGFQVLKRVVSSALFGATAEDPHAHVLSDGDNFYGE